MVHLGDICKINGAEIEPVWCITGGSPCQDLSIAGKRAGLAGARSGLFMEQVRIVKEMREADKRNGRTGDMVRPRYLVWENVVGAFSSNKGKDFAAVLEEIIKIVESEAPSIEVPEKGWPSWGGYHDEVGGRWSVVWRTHDAQYWGVPQRRRRISVVADFGGDTASEIQFDGESLPGDIAESGASGEGPAEAAESGFNPAVGDCMTAWDCQSKRIFDTNGKSPTLQGGVGGGVNNPAIFCMATQPGGVALDMTHACDVIRECGEQVPALQARMGTGGNQVPLTYQMNGFGDYRDANVASSCKQRDFKDSTDLVCAVDCRNFREGGEVNGTLQAKESGGQSLNLNNTVRQNMVVRRLTPMECERLQGFPDHWTDIGEWMDEKGKKHKDADSPRYKALGSLFDGIAGFPLIWERIHGKGTAQWASEIEPFPIAVTKKWFGEE